MARASDNLIGVSHNQFVIRHADTAAITRAVSGKVARARAYPDLNLVIVRTDTFEQLLPLQEALSRQFPTAKFQLPVRYFARKLK